MIGEAIQSDTLQALVSQHAIREAVVGRVNGDNSKWTLSVRLAVPRRAWYQCAPDVSRCALGQA